MTMPVYVVLNFMQSSGILIFSTVQSLRVWGYADETAHKLRK